MPYRNWGSGDTLNAADLNAMTADPSIATLAGNDTVSLTSYGDGATPGPAVTLTMVNGQTALVLVSATVWWSATGHLKNHLLSSIRTERRPIVSPAL
jgi:hypothetical protein